MREIQLTQGQVALIDDEDYELIRRYSWFAQYNFNTDSYYAVANIPNNTKKSYCEIVRMHRLIAGTSKEYKTDHKNRDTLDNRRENLRSCNDSQSACNRDVRADSQTGLKGVTFEKDKKLYRAIISYQGKRIGLGRYKSAQDASNAYEAKAKELHGEFYYKKFEQEKSLGVEVS